MKKPAKVVTALLMATILGISGCGNGNTSNNGDTGNSTASPSNASNAEASASDTNNAATEDAKVESSNNGFDIDAYIANYTPKTELTNNSLFDYEVKINGVVLTCPISTAELAALGYETPKAYTVEVSPDKVSRMNNNGGFYIHKDSGVELVLDSISTTSSEPFVFDSDTPRDDVLFYSLDVNTNETYWEHDKSFTIEFYGGTVTNYDSQYNSGTEILTSEADIIEKCGEFNDKESDFLYYYEFPETEHPSANMVSVMLNDSKIISSISLVHKFDKESSQIISKVK